MYIRYAGELISENMYIDKDKWISFSVYPLKELVDMYIEHRVV